MVLTSLIRDSWAAIFNQKRLGLFLLILCFVVLSALSYSGLINPLSHDEAYLLQVADMLAKGEGYASYGVLKGDGPWLFSPHITVGPVVLIPLSLLWHLAEGNVTAVRAFMLVSSYLYLIGLFRLFWNEKSGLLIPALAIASSLCVVNFVGVYAEQAIGLVLGEMSAAAAIVWAGWAIKENRPYLAATMAGISIQIKLVFTLAGSIVLLAWLIPAIASSERVRYRVILAVGLLYALPTLVFELWRFFSHDSVDAWLVNLDEIRYFLQVQNVNLYWSWMDPGILHRKLSGFYSSLPATAWIASGIAVLPILLSAGIWLAQLGKRREAPTIPTFLPTEGKSVAFDTNKFPLAASIGLGIAGLAMSAGWITQSAQLNSRQALPFFLLFIPSVFAIGGYCCFRASVVCRGHFMARSMTLSSVLYVVLLTVALVSRLEDNIESNKELKARKTEQEHVVNIIRSQNAESLFVDTTAGAGIWQNAVYQLLTPIQAVPLKTGASQIMIVSTFLRDVSQKSFSEYEQECEEVLYSTSNILVCRLPEFDKEEADIQVLDWGPRQTAPGMVPNRQIDGGGGLWITIREVGTKKVGPMAIYFAGQSAFYRTTFTGQVITATLPPRFFNRPGKHEVSLKQLVTGRVFPVGYFQVGGDVP